MQLAYPGTGNYRKMTKTFHAFQVKLQGTVSPVPVYRRSVVTLRPAQSMNGDEFNGVI